MDFLLHYKMSTINDITAKYGGTFTPATSFQPTEGNSITDKYGGTFTPAQTPPQPSAFPNTTKSLQDISSDPFNLNADPSKAFGDAVDAVKGIFTNEWNNIGNLFQSKSISEGSGNLLKTAVGAVPFIPAAAPAIFGFSILFGAAKDIPVLGTVSKLIDTAFNALPEGASSAAGGIIDKLPIPQDVKDNIKGGVQQAASLATQIGEFAIAHKVIRPYLPSEKAAAPFRDQFVKDNPAYSKDIQSVPAKEINKLTASNPDEAAAIVKKSIDWSRAQRKLPPLTTEEPPNETPDNNVPTDTIDSKYVAEYKAPENVSEEAYQNTIKNGGVTISLEGNQPKEGIAYAPYKDTEQIVSKENFTPQTVDDYMAKHADKLNQEGNHLGMWEEDGKIYLDISKVGDNTPGTFNEAANANQLAVHDLSTHENIPIGKIENGVYTKDYEKTSDHPHFNQREDIQTSSRGTQNQPGEVPEDVKEVTPNPLSDSEIKKGEITPKPEGNKITKGASDLSKLLIAQGEKPIPEENQAKFQSSEGQRFTEKKLAKDFVSEMTKTDTGTAKIKDIIRGDEPLPEGLRGQDLYHEVKTWALKNDVEFATLELGKSPLNTELSQAASTLQSADHTGDKDSFAQQSLDTLKKLNEEKKIKAESQAKKEGTTINKKLANLKEKSDNVVKQTKEERAPLRRARLHQFIDSLPNC